MVSANWRGCDVGGGKPQRKRMESCHGVMIQGN